MEFFSILVFSSETGMKRGEVGKLGEELVARFLMKHGYRILERNYRRPWGELDIIAERKARVHFVEVKALLRDVSDETDETPRSGHGKAKSEVSPETAREETLKYIRQGSPKDRFRPEDQMSSKKIKRLSRIIRSYLGGKDVSSETPWQFDLATVLIDESKRKAKVDFLEYIVL